MIKKWLSILLILSILPFTTVNSDSGIVEMNTPELSFLKSIGGITNNMILENDMTRGLFCGILVNLMYPNLSFFQQKGSSFYDVGINHAYYSPIQILKDLSIITGDQFNKFYPDVSITYTDAVTILLNSMGYKQYADAFGGYPTGYLTLARDLGLLKNVEIYADSLSTQNGLKVIYNSLFADSVQTNYLSDNGADISINREENILRKNLGIKEYDAILYDDGMSSFDENTAAFNDRIIIKDLESNSRITVKNTIPEIYHYFGNRLRIFVRQDKNLDEDVVVHFEPHKKNQEIQLRGDQIINVNKDYIEYEKEKEAIRYEKIHFNRDALPYIFVNGLRVYHYTFEDLIPEEGMVNFIDHNGDKRPEVIKITKFNFTMVINSVYPENQTILCRQNPINNLDLSDSGKIKFRVIKDGAFVDLSEIKPMDILSVARSEENDKQFVLYYLYVETKKITSKVSSVFENTKEIEVNNLILPISQQLLNNNSKLMEQLLTNSSELTIYLDYLGSVAYIDGLSKIGKDYYYLIDIYKKDNFEDNLALRVFGKSSEFQDFSIKSGIVIDGDTVNESNSEVLFKRIRDLLCKRPDGKLYVPSESILRFQNKSITNIAPRPALLTINSKGYITEIDTDTGDDSHVKGNNLNFHKRFIRNLRYFPASGSVDGTFFITNDTVILKVPDIDRYQMDNMSTINMNNFEQDLFDLENYGVYFPSDITDYNGYDLSIYNVDQNTGIAGLVLIRGRDMRFYNTGGSDPLLIFLKLTDYYDESTGQHFKKLYYSLDGKEHSVVVDREKLHPYYQNILYGGKHAATITGTGLSETATYVDVEPLEAGDVIHVIASGGYLTHIHRDLNLSKINSKVASSTKSSAPSAPYSPFAYSTTNVGVPFDERLYPTYAFSNSYNYELAVPISMSGNKILLKLPLNSAGANSGTWLDYINNNYPTLDKFMIIKQLNITVVEEVQCDVHHDRCKYIVRKGTIADIRFSSSYSEEDGFYKASRLYYFNARGEYRDIVIFNLSESHNRHQ